jgi:hypothetical protein
MENILGLSAPGGELDVPELAAALTRIYREEIIPDRVAEFESWGFERKDLVESDEAFFEFLVLASYDRQPFTFKGGYEAVWSEDPGSVRRLLESRRLLKLSTIRALGEEDLRSHLTALVFGPWRLAHDRKKQGAGGTDYARTLRELAEHTSELRTLCATAVSEWDVASLHYRFDNVHGIGPTIAAKLVKYLLREIRVADVDPSNFQRIVPHLLQDFDNSVLLRETGTHSPQTLGRRIQAEMTKLGEPLAIEALFYVDKEYEGKLPERFRGTAI